MPPVRSFPKIAPGQLPPPSANDNTQTQSQPLSSGRSPVTSPKKINPSSTFQRKLSNGLEESDSESSDTEMIIEEAKPLAPSSKSVSTAKDDDDLMIIEESNKPTASGAAPKRKSNQIDDDPFQFKEPDISCISQAKRHKTEFSIKSRKETNRKQVVSMKGAQSSYHHSWKSEETESDSVPVSLPVNKPITPTKQSTSFGRFASDPVLPSGSRTSAFSLSRQMKNVHQVDTVMKRGELADFNEDLEYFMSVVKEPTASENAVYQSIYSLTKKSIKVEFRNFLRRGHNLSKVFDAIAPHMNSQRIAATAAVLISIFARDRQGFDPDEKFTALVLPLLKLKNDTTHPDYAVTVDATLGLLEEWTRVTGELLRKTFTVSLTKDNFNISYLTLEALAFLFIQKPKNAFLQIQLLDCGILQWIVMHVEKLTKRLAKCNDQGDGTVPIVRELRRCMKILEGSCLGNVKTQIFLMSGGGFSLLQSSTSLIQQFQKFIENCSEESRPILFDSVGAVVRVLMNMTHENELCCTKLVSMNNFLEVVLNFITETCPKFAQKDKSFEVILMLLALLVNIAEKSSFVRSRLLTLTPRIYNTETKISEVEPALTALTKYFIHHEAAARTIDEEFDRHFEVEEAPEEEEVPEDGKSQRELSEAEVLEAVQSVMSKADVHMEDTVMGSYYGLLVGCLIQRDTPKAMQVKEMLPNKSFTSLIEQLHRFKDFMNATHKRCAELISLERILGALQGYSAL